ncbi:MAG TPA: START domain-containing protein [Polyangiales bacterium]
MISLAFAPGTQADDAAGWRFVSDSDGVKVSKRTEPGSDVATFRGQAKLRGAVLHLLSVLTDDARSPEWQDTLTEARRLRVLDGLRSQLVYSRTNQPWPIRDRELVMHRTIDIVEHGKAYRVRLVCKPEAIPAHEGVVRVTDCDSSFLLRQLEDGLTYVEAQVRVDAGGATPGWITNMASKNVTRETLTALQKQADRTMGQYAAHIAQWQAAR